MESIGLKRLIANKYRFSETDRTKTELQKYKSENSSVLSFIDECCSLGAKAEITAGRTVQRLQ